MTATVQTTKRCTRCGEVKVLDDFHKAPTTRDRRQGRCKVCALAAAREWYAANTERANERARRWQELHPELAERYKYTSHLRARYGITYNDYAVMFAAQAGQCAICRTDQPGGKKNKWFSVDHDHVTGRVRGLLCDGCNNMLGRAQDDPERLIAAARYLGADL